MQHRPAATRVLWVTTALYRRYRPDSFEDVIGQEHVTGPLMQALSKDRVNHAYLFSGPRGCGKTTSARILARCLNCAQGPTPTPCGQCDSCQELATGGSGALDVIEIDAASHGGVDDARDLRERATFAPVRDRYKIFIIDEAHMVTSAGFNALLKIVEEPPEHIKFIFATTEPDKVIGTIRSRTHHYPFRLVPPEPLMEYLERLCAQENVAVAPGVLSLVVRSGGGSVRDTLSVLDQLMAGATEDGLAYDLTVNLLGYTPDALLDDVVDAVAASDSQTVFRVVDRVVQSGQDPRRFVEDLLERFRDLVIVKAMPDAASSVLHGMPEDQLRRLETQAAQLGGGELSRAADITNHALTEMVGATSPRLHLELLMARLMLPSTDQTERGLAARLDRIERRLSYGGQAEAGLPDAGPAPSPGASPQQGGQGMDQGAPGQQGLSGAALARAAMRRDQQGEAPAERPDQAPQTPQSAARPPAVQPAQDSPVPPSEPNTPTIPPAAVSGEAEQEREEQAEQHPAAATPVPQSQRPDEPAAGPDHQPGVPEHDQSAPRQQDEPVQTDQAPTPSQSSPQTQRPAAPAPSADWGGTWAVPPEEPARQDRPAPSQAQHPAPAQQEPQARQTPPNQREQLRPAPPAPDGPSASAADRGAPQHQQAPGQQPESPAGPPQQPSGGGNSVEMIRRAWPEVLDVLQENARFIWIVVSQNASVAGFDGQLLTIGFANDGARDRVQQRGGDQDIARAVNQVLGMQPQIDLITGGAAPAGGPGPKAEGRPTPAAPQPQQSPAPAPAAGRQPAAPAPAPEREHQPAAPAPQPDRPAGPTGGRPAEPQGPPPADENPWALPPEPDEDPFDPYEEQYAPEDDPYAPLDTSASSSAQDPDRGALDAEDIPVSDAATPATDSPAAPAPAEPTLEESAPAESAPEEPKVSRPEPGWGIPVFARPEAEMRAERAGGAGFTAASTAGESSATTSGQTAPDSSGTPHGRRASRFQQMMEQYNRTQAGAAAPHPGTSPQASSVSAGTPAGAPTASSPADEPGASEPSASSPQADASGEGPSSGRPGAAGGATGAAHSTGGVNAPGGNGSVDWSDETPSDDDETIEDSGLAGRPVVERILGARLIEERSLDGGPLG